MQRSEQNGRHFDSGVHGTSALHCGHLTMRGGIVQVSRHPAGAGTALHAASVAAPASNETVSSAIANAANVIIAAAASVTTVSTAAPDVNCVLMMRYV